MVRLLYVALICLPVFSCGFVNEPKKVDPCQYRELKGVYTAAMEDRGEVNFQEKMQQVGDWVEKMKPSTFDQHFYSILDGQSTRFILQKSSKDAAYVDYTTGEAASIDINKDAPFSLVIGQSKAHLYYYYGGDRGTRFYQYAFESKETKEITIADFVVIRVADTDREDGALLACGVYKKDKPTLGFYLLDANSAQVIEIVHEIALKKTVPDGDPGVYVSDFYTFEDQVFFRFEKRSGIFQFDKKGNFMREIDTPDKFDFPKEDKTASNTTYDDLYQEFFVHKDTLYVRPRFGSGGQKKQLYFDAYDLGKGLYSHTFALQLDYPDEEYFFYHLWMDQASRELNFFFIRRDNPTVYLHKVLPVPPWSKDRL